VSTLSLDFIQQAPATTLLSRDTAKSTLLVAATGTGKTIMMAGLADSWPLGRVMMISHRFELNTQARETFESFCSESVDFEQASFEADQCNVSDRCRIVVASVQSLNSKRKGRRRFEKFDPNEFGLIMIDEAHRAVSPTYRRVIAHFQDNNPDCCLVGVTATPDRLDGVGLGHAFETVACDLNIRWGIDHGWLVPLRQTFVTVDGLDFSSIRSRKNEAGESDLDPRELAKIVETEKVLHEMAGPIIEIAGEKSCIVFCASVSQSERICEILNRHRAQCAMSIDGSMPPMDPRRQELIERFKRGDVQFFCNCGIATEGFDAPIAEVVAVARPTKSRALYCQMIGRVTRPVPGVVDGREDSDERKSAIATSRKPHARVIDFLGQAGRHSLVCTGDVLAGENDPQEIVDAAKSAAQQRDFDGDMIAAMEQAKEDAARIEAARRAKITARVNYRVTEVDIWSPMQWAPPRSVPGFENATPPSERMKAAMGKFGLTKQEIGELNSKQASAVLSKCIGRIEMGLCSLKQKRLLSKFGVDANRMTMDQASAAIDKIAKNGWKRT